MASIDFQNGTIIPASWLNDVDAAVYEKLLPEGTHVATAESVTAVQAGLAASGGSALVGHLPAGVGAVARTVQSKLRESVSVKDFGAVGDGATDDIGAFIACREYCRVNKAKMVLPKGVYRLGSPFYFGTTGIGPYAGYDIQGDGPNSTTLLLDFNGSVGIDLNPGTGGYTAFAVSAVGGFRVQVAVAKAITCPIKIQNAYNCTFHNIHVYCDKNTVNSSFTGVRVSGAVYFNTFTNIWVEAYNGDPTSGKGFYVGNGRGDVALDGANTSVNTFINCRTRGFAVGFDTVLANNTVYQSCDAEVSTIGFRDMATYWSSYRDCWNEGSPTGLLVDESTYTNGNGTAHAAAAAAWLVVDGGSWGGPISLQKCLSPRIKSYVNEISISSAAEDVKWAHTGATTPTVTGAANDSVLEYRPTAPIVRNVTSLGSKRWCYQFPTSSGPAEIHWHASNDNPLLSAYRTTGAGANFSGYRIEAAAGGALNFYTWFTGGMANETPVRGLTINNGTAILLPQSGASPANNGELVIAKVSNTQISIKLKGDDGVVRSVSLTLA